MAVVSPIPRRNQKWVQMALDGLTEGASMVPDQLVLAKLHGAIYLAAVLTKDKSLEVQQVAVSVAAHRILGVTFRNSNVIQEEIASTLQEVVSGSGLKPGGELDTATSSGLEAALEVLQKRVDECLDQPATYTWPGTSAGQYQPTEGQGPVPMMPQAVCIRPFCLSNITTFRAPPPPALDTIRYVGEIFLQRAKGSRTSSSRDLWENRMAFLFVEMPTTYELCAPIS